MAAEEYFSCLFEAKSHLTIEELYTEVKERNPDIGVATVYRMVRILCECGLACGFKDTDGNYKYELGREYHEHLICVKCGRVVEVSENAEEVPATVRSA